MQKSPEVTNKRVSERMSADRVSICVRNMPYAAGIRRGIPVNGVDVSLSGAAFVTQMNIDEGDSVWLDISCNGKCLSDVEAKVVYKQKVMGVSKVGVCFNDSFGPFEKRRLSALLRSASASSSS